MTATSEGETHATGSLAGVRVVEIGDERIDYCGFVLAGLGAEVVKVEPPEGSPSRRIGPYYEDVVDAERSLYFWAHNRGKQSIVLDPARDGDRETLAALVASADVLLTTDGVRGIEAFGSRCQDLLEQIPHLVAGRLTGFGDDGPWVDYQASDLVHLALGGVAMNCGYDPDPAGRYDMPPLAPQAFHSWYIAGEQLAFTVIAALCRRGHTGTGQYLSCAIHEAVAKNTEADVMSWILLATPFHRQTCWHSAENLLPQPVIAATKDGRWIMTLTRDPKILQPFMESFGVGAEIYEDQVSGDAGSRILPGMEAGSSRSMEVVQRVMRRWRFDDVPWKDAQNAGLMWVPLRKPEENVDDEHWAARGTFADVHHPEFDRSFRYPVSKWISCRSHWSSSGRAAARRGPHAVLGTVGRVPVVPRSAVPDRMADRRSKHGAPFALNNVRILDFSWYLATAGATRFLAALGADVIKVEWKDKLDPRRGGAPRRWPRRARESHRAGAVPVAAGSRR